MSRFGVVVANGLDVQVPLAFVEACNALEDENKIVGEGSYHLFSISQPVGLDEREGTEEFDVMRQDYNPGSRVSVEYVAMVYNDGFPELVYITTPHGGIVGG